MVSASSLSLGHLLRSSSCEFLVVLYILETYLDQNLVIVSIVALRKNVGFIALFGVLTITFALLAAGELAASVK